MGLWRQMAGRDTEQQQETSPHKRDMIARIAARFQKTGRSRTAAPATDHPKKRSLVSKLMWTAACIPLANLIGVMTLSVPLDNSSAEMSRTLTSSEAALAQAVFGSDFQTDNITLYLHNGAPDHIFNQLDGDRRERTLAYVNPLSPNDVHIIDEDTHARDYARTRNVSGQSETFIHELTHVWQFRADISAPSCSNYEYKLTAQSRLEDFCVEQQAEIISDYVIRHVAPDQMGLGLMAYDYMKDRGTGTPITIRMFGHDPNLIRVVEEALPHIRAARLQSEQHVKATFECTFNAVAPRVSFRSIETYNYSDEFNTCAARHLVTFDGLKTSVSAERSPLEADPPPRPATASTQRGQRTVVKPG